MLHLSSTQNSWYGDNRTICDIIIDDFGMLNFRFINVKVTGITEQTVTAKKWERKMCNFYSQIVK